jgi:hypothetical protein
MNRRFFITGLAMTLATPVLLLSEQAAAASVLLGTRIVNWLVDRDSIHVGVGRGRFRGIQLKVRRNGIHLIDLKVRFGNGSAQDVAVRSIILAGGPNPRD